MLHRCTFIVICLFFCITVSTVPQSNIFNSQKDFISVPAQLQNKIGSGRLMMKLSEKNAMINKGVLKKGSSTAQVIVYCKTYPTQQQIDELHQRGLTCYLQTWTPPMENHPLGFFIAELSIDKLNDVLSLDFVKKLDTAEGTSIPMNNNASKSIKANAAWTKGWTGKGIKVGVLDSGIDTTYSVTDLPVFEKKDYSLFPQIDDDVINHITGHGTHVTGIILGKGNLSLNNIGNDGDAYKGMAPDASLAFFKIGDDSTANASDASVIAALNDAVNVYHVQVINMSYGGWGAYHDGSEPVDQKADWCYNQGVVVCFAAGNDAANNKHFMGTVPANSETDFIQVNVYNADSTKTRPSFNLVWFDGIGTQNNLTLKYYDASKNEITNVNRALITESPRGTESQYSSMQQFTPSGNSIYFVKVVNASNANQLYHIYEDYTQDPHGVGNITFSNASQEYTIGSPSTADHVLSVAAYTSRASWKNSQGDIRRYNQTLDKITNFSSHGPRVDGAQKPDIAAPGSSLISLRDKDVFKTFDNSWVDNDGVASGDADYYVMQGTSMASPVCAGAAALLLSKYPSLTPKQVYDSLRYHAKRDAYTGSTPNPIYGIGKLDVSFLSGINASSDGWYQVNPLVFTPQDGIPGIVVNAQGVVFVNVGKPWTTDMSTIYKSTDDGITWWSLTSAPSLAALAIQSNGTLFTAGRNQGLIYRSIDNGNSWTSHGTPHDYTSISVTPDDSIVASTYGQGIFYSDNNGINWTAINDGLPANAKVPLVATAYNRFYALVMTNGTVRMYNCNRGHTWKISDTGIDTTKNVNACAVMHDGTVFAAVYDRIYRSIDNGITWQQITILNDYLQYLHVYSNTTLFVGTVGGGVYRSTDKGNSWSSFSDGLTTLNIAMMGSNGNGMLYAGADREKVFRRNIGALPTKVILVEPANNMINAAIPTTFKWQQENSATSYWIQISSAQDFSTLLVNQQFLNQLNWQLDFFARLTKYYWRVCAVNNAGVGNWSDTWSFTTVPPPPAAPYLVFPFDASIDIQINPTFRWDTVPDATSYRLQVSTDPTFSSTEFDQSNITSTSHAVSGLLNNVKYYWRVNASNAGGAGAWSSVWNFTTVGAAPTAPNLILPNDGVNNVQLDPILFWNRLSNADSYTLQVGFDANFMPPLAFSKSGITDTSQIVTGLSNNQKYFWRVNATNKYGVSPWSTVWNFTTAMKSLAAPMLLSPVNNAVNIFTDTTMIWTAITGATSYRLQVSTDAGFSTTFFDQSNITTTSQRVSGLAKNTKYYWRVEATDGTTTSSWSTVWNFTTILAPPIAPTLLTPIDNAAIVLLPQTFVWNPSASATSYRLQISLSTFFTTPIVDQVGITQTIFSPTGLNYNTKYYWRVNAMNAGGTSAWSSIWSFTTTPQTDVEDVNLPASIQLEQNYPNPFSERTAISFKLLAFSHVRLELFDIFGRKLVTLFDELQEAGTHTINFVPDMQNLKLTSGLYFYRATANNTTITKIMHVLR